MRYRSPRAPLPPANARGAANAPVPRREEVKRGMARPEARAAGHMRSGPGAREKMHCMEDGLARHTTEDTR